MEVFRSPTRSQGSLSSTGSIRSPLQRREALRSALNRTKTIHNVDDKTMENLEHIVREADEICHEVTMEEKVSGHDEVLMDSEVMAALSKVLKSSANTLTKDISPYDSRDYAEKLLQCVHMLPDQTLATANWSILEDDICKLFKRTATFSAVCGCLDPVEKKVVVKRQVVPKQRDALAPIKRPEAVVELDEVDTGVEEAVSKIKRLISKHYKDNGTALELYRLILHPKEFSKTIENMLHVSFLVKDRWMQIKMENGKNPVIKPTTKEMRHRVENSDDKVNIQNILSLNPQQWQFLVATLNIQEPMIKF